MHAFINDSLLHCEVFAHGGSSLRCTSSCVFEAQVPCFYVIKNSTSSFGREALCLYVLKTLSLETLVALVEWQNASLTDLLGGPLDFSWLCMPPCCAILTPTLPTHARDTPL
jgi:hypothetical protein